MSRYKVYSEYKDSETEWLGQIPSSWGVKRLGQFFDERREKVSDEDYPALSVTMQGIVPQLETAAKTDAGDNRKLVLKNDFVINSRSDRKGSSGVSSYDGSVSLISIVMTPREIHPPFAHHLLRSYPFQEEFYRYGKGIVADLWSTNASEMKNILIPDISISEQEKIAAFLDHETAKIDALIEKQQRLIELLKEKRQAVISHAVTKGLNPNAPMKDSGVEWLGEAPANWGVQRVKFVSSFTTSGPRGWSELVGEDGALFIQSGDLNDALAVDFADAKRVQVGNNAETQRTLLCHGDVVVCITGAKTGNVAVCSVVPEASYINQHLCLIRPTSEIHPVFLAVLLKSTVGQTYFELSQYGLKQGLSLEDVREAPVFVPPSAEQATITTYLAAETEKLDVLCAQALLSKDLLQERRTALISATVTGKIDVRDWQAAA